MKLQYRYIELASTAVALAVASAPAVSMAEPCGTTALRLRVPVRPVQWSGPLRDEGAFPKVGDTRGFWTYDLSVMPPDNVQVPSTCRAVGARTAIWVADDQWGDAVTQADVDVLLAALEDSAPRTPGKGIVENNEELFGPPARFAQGDPDLTLFIYDIPDYQGYTFDGFFRAEDLGPFNPACASNPQLYCSNELGMIHVDSKDPASPYMQGVIAHEYEHLAHFRADPYEENWLDESMAELAMVYNGYEDPSNLAHFAAFPGTSLVKVPPVDYGACLLFGAYLQQLLGNEGIRSLVESKLTGLASVSQVLPEGMDLRTFFAHWIAANALDDTTIGDGSFGYDLVDVPGFATTAVGPLPVDASYNVPPTAGAYLSLDWTPGVDSALQVGLGSQDPGTGGHVAVPSVPWADEIVPGGDAVLVPAPAPGQAFGLLVVLSNADPASSAQAKLTMNEVPYEPSAPDQVAEETVVLEDAGAVGDEAQVDAVPIDNGKAVPDAPVADQAGGDAAPAGDSTGGGGSSCQASGPTTNRSLFPSVAVLLAFIMISFLSRSRPERDAVAEAGGKTTRFGSNDV